MTERARREYAEVMRRRYQPADKRERGRMLDEYCRTTGCHRKAAIRRLGAADKHQGANSSFLAVVKAGCWVRLTDPLTF